MTAARPVALVTGASSGIGRALAGQFAAGGYDVVLVARREDALRAVATELEARHGGRAHVVAVDLARPDAAGEIARAVAERGLEIDALVNNAGFALHGPFVHGDPTAQQALLQVNVVAPTALARAFAPGMAARGRGRILNVASTAAFQPGPHMAVYYASKAYVLQLSVALSVELERSGVTVTALCPGPTRTGFADRAGVTGTRLFAGGRGADVERVARAGYRGLLRGNPIVVPGAGNRLLALAARLVPRRFAARLAGRLQEPA